MNVISFTRRLIRPAVLTLMFAVAACSKKDAPATLPAGPTNIVINRPALYPESVVYDAASDRFLLSSVTAGAVGQVAVDGTYTPLADDPQLVSSNGVCLDAPHNRVLVAVGDLGGNSARTSSATQYKLAALASFDRTTGRRLAYTDLGGLRPGVAHFANDVAVDTQGNAYVTDSFAGIIYKVDAQGVASVFVEDRRFAAPAGSFGMDGIVCHPDGYLLVIKWDEGLLFKVPLATPTTFTQVAAPTYLSADGLRLTDNNTLLIAANGLAPTASANSNKVFRVSSSDGWATAATTGSVATGDVFPTALALRGADIYLLQSHINAQLSGQNPPVAQFGLQKITF